MAGTQAESFEIARTETVITSSQSPRLGLPQPIDVLSHGYWHARGLDYLNQEFVKLLEWAHMPGDTVFIVSGVIPLVIAAGLTYIHQWKTPVIRNKTLIKCRFPPIEIHDLERKAVPPGIKYCGQRAEVLLRRAKSHPFNSAQLPLVSSRPGFLSALSTGCPRTEGLAVSPAGFSEV